MFFFVFPYDCLFSFLGPVSRISFLFYLHVPTPSLPKAKHLPFESRRSVQIIALPYFIPGLLLISYLLGHHELQQQFHCQECPQLVLIMLHTSQLLLPSNPVVPDQKVFKGEEAEPRWYLFFRHSREVTHSDWI